MTIEPVTDAFSVPSKARTEAAASTVAVPKSVCTSAVNAGPVTVTVEPVAVAVEAPGGVAVDRGGEPVRDVGRR